MVEEIFVSTDAYHHYWDDVLNTDGISGITDYSNFISCGEVYTYTTPGAVRLRHGQVYNRTFGYDSGDPGDDYEMLGGFYCIDYNTGTNQYIDYQLMNIEDAVAADYYSYDDVSHIRAILKNGYEWYNGPESTENLRNALVEYYGDERFLSLTEKQAALATNMAIWQFGNRYTEDIYLSCVASDPDIHELVDDVYRYLITLTDDNDSETPIITEDKFIRNLGIEIGAQAAGFAENADDDEENDIYDVSIRFTLAEEIDEGSDDLVAIVTDSDGSILQKARIAGAVQEDEIAVETVRDGRTAYYSIPGLKLSENEATVLNIKLLGKQMLEKGVYVCISADLSPEDAARAYVDYLKNHRKGVYGSLDAEDCDADYAKLLAQYGDDEAIVAALTGTKSGVSQNHVGYFSGPAGVDISMTLDLTFTVDEADIETVHEWDYIAPRRPKTEKDPVEEPVEDVAVEAPAEEVVEDLPAEDVPLAEAPVEEPEEVYEDIASAAVPLADAPEELEEVPEDPVPLADVPATGVNDGWYVIGIIASLMAAAFVAGRRRAE